MSGIRTVNTCYIEPGSTVCPLTLEFGSWMTQDAWTKLCFSIWIKMGWDGACNIVHELSIHKQWIRGLIKMLGKNWELPYNFFYMFWVMNDDRFAWLKPLQKSRVWLFREELRFALWKDSFSWIYSSVVNVVCGVVFVVEDSLVILSRSKQHILWIIDCSAKR